VTLGIAGMRALEARIEEVGDCHAILGLFREPDRPLTRLGTASATIEAMGRRGRLRAAVKVRQHNGEPDAVWAEFDGETEVVQQRGFFRLDVMTKVVVSRESGAQAETHTLDISASGLLLAGPRDLKVGERVWVAIDIDEETPVRASGRVARAPTDQQRAVQLDRIEDAARERLIRYLFARQRDAVRVRQR